MDLEKLRALFDLLAEKDIAEFEHEEDGVRILVSRGARALAAPPSTQPSPIAQSVAPAGLAAAIAASGPVSVPGGDLVDVTSPFVGSFYRSASPDVPPFVEVGSVVRAGQTLCIIEAMKLMNEIESDVSGTVTEVCVPNGKAVEFGQKLFRIKKA